MNINALAVQLFSDKRQVIIS